MDRRAPMQQQIHDGVWIECGSRAPLSGTPRPSLVTRRGHSRRRKDCWS